MVVVTTPDRGSCNPRTGRTMKLKQKMVGATLAVLALGGIGAGVASAATSTPSPSATSSSTPAAVDTPEAGDTPDAPGAVDTPGAGDTPDVAGAVDTDNVQEGDQSGPDTADTGASTGK